MEEGIGVLQQQRNRMSSVQLCTLETTEDLHKIPQ